MLALTLFVGACQSQQSTTRPVPNPEQPPSTEAAIAASPEPVSTDETDEAAAASKAAEDIEPLMTQTPEQNNAIEVEPTSIQSAESSRDEAIEGSPPAEESKPTAEVVVNGVYEGTYFRGWESAPVTMVDYSDFL